MPELPPQYHPKDVEERLYQQWEAQGFFHTDVDTARTPYTIVIPPPNITGILHMGHALNDTIQDILIRFQRMRGANALWVPGTDHAGIATQNVVERDVAKEIVTYKDDQGRTLTRPKNREDLGREAFIQRVWAWKEQYGNTIIHQLKRLGASCDWRRTRFTMDEGLSAAVTEVFLRLYEKGLIYRGNYIINWCPRCQTALADEEAPRQPTQGKLYHIRYPLEQPAGSFIEVATTRPETMLGDTAIAVHPKDKRYKSLIGKFAILPLVSRRLPIIADELVDREFGTGAVKVTPAHDPVDFQLGKKHDLTFINVMTDDGRMADIDEVPVPYRGLDRFECRSKLIVDLEQQGFLGRIDEHAHNVGHCYRCHTIVEPRLSPQWFVKMKPLAKPAIKAVKDGTIQFVPSRWTKVYLNWMENIQDWCISRQIWWGHRLPVYYCDACILETARTVHDPGRLAAESDEPGVIVSKTRPERCPMCGSTTLRQDEDVLDTWFSSWLWPFSTLGWPEKTKDLKYFYPTSTLVTAQEIIFFWVARMIMAGYFCMKQPPFTRVYIHGTVRDITGKKMSKSLGNIIDPLEIIKEYGTDALRYTLVTATALGQDIFLSEERFAVGRNFANKLWNATRFTIAQQAHEGVPEAPVGQSPTPRTVADQWILSRLQRTIERVTSSLNAFLLNDAANALYDFIWHDLCDWYIEIAKIQLTQMKSRAGTLAVMVHVLEVSFRLLHPIMPFVTEELWQHVKHDQGVISIMVAEWPKPVKRLIDVEAEERFEQLKAVVVAIRNTRAELNVPVESRPAVRLTSSRAPVREFFASHRTLLQRLAAVGDVHVDATRQRLPHAAAAVVDGIEVLMPLEGLIDVQRERARLQQRVEELTRHVERLDARLRDPQFTQKAPNEVVEQTRAQRTQISDTLKKVSEHLAVVQSMS